MNATQRRILGVGLVLVAVMALFPPWRMTTVHVGQGEGFQGAGPAPVSSTARPAGYRFIAAPPTPEQYNISVQIDVAQIAIQFVALVTIVGGLVAITGGRGKDGGG